MWGNVPDGAFAVTGNSVVSVMGLPASSPGTRAFTIQFNSALAPGTDNVVYTPPSTAGLRLMMPDGIDVNTDPDEVATFTVGVTEEDNPPVLPTIMDVAVMSSTTYTAASPAATLPAVMGASGTGTITYAILATAPLPAGLTMASVDVTNADFGKITGSPTAPDGTVAVVTWTATDSDTPTEVANGNFRIVVQSVPGMPGTLTATAGDASVMLSWTAPTTGGAVTGYEYEQTVNGVSGGWMSTGMGTNTMLELTGLMNGTTYAYRVRAVNTAGGGAVSNIATAMPVAAVVVPGMPGTLTAVAGSGHVTLSWTAPTSGGAVAGYEYEQTAGGVTAGWMPTGMGTTTTLTVTGLTNGITYTFRVRAVNTAGRGRCVEHRYGDAGCRAGKNHQFRFARYHRGRRAGAGDGVSERASTGGAVRKGQAPSGGQAQYPPEHPIRRTDRRPLRCHPLQAVGWCSHVSVGRIGRRRLRCQCRRRVDDSGRAELRTGHGLRHLG